MDPIFEPLLAKAFRRVPAREANAAISEVRQGEAEEVRNFELVAPADASLEWLEKQVLPKLVYHLESLGVRPPDYTGIFLSLFWGDELFFLRMRDLMSFAGEALHLTADQMYQRWGTGELRRAVRPDEGKVKAEEKPRPVLALPTGKPG